MLHVLIDADNLSPRRLRPVLTVLAELDDPVEVIVSGRQSALDGSTWPEQARLLPQQGWQRADLALAEAYRPDTDPLVLVSGDGDFGLLASRHPGPVLVVSSAASGRLRDGATVIDPATEGDRPIRAWLRAVGVRLRD